MKFHPAIGLIALLGLAACNTSGPTASTQMTPASAGSSAASPQSANSLPRGDVVNAPRTPNTGSVTTAVPARTY